MSITVLFFSTLREITGQESLSMDLEEKGPVTVGDVLERLYVVYPTLRDWDAQILLALDQSYVQQRDQPITDGQELAVMPPVQGG